MWLAFAVLCGTMSSVLCVRDDQFYGPQTFQNHAQTRAHTVQYSDSVSLCFFIYFSIKI